MTTKIPPPPPPNFHSKPGFSTSFIATFAAEWIIAFAVLGYLFWRR